jgi:uncharacterized protein YicC (UPF0701 family)
MDSQQFFDEFRQQIAIIMGTVEMALMLDKSLHPEELRRLKTEIAKLYQLLLTFQAGQDNGEQ